MKKENLNPIFSQVMSLESAAFLIDEQKFIDNISSLQLSFRNYYPKVTLGYSYKTNYIPSVCRAAHKFGCWAEAVSSMEVDMAMIHLLDKSNIIYNGPIKSFDSIKKVIEVGGVINIDDIYDIEKIELFLSSNKSFEKEIKLAVRLNFAFNDLSNIQDRGLPKIGSHPIR